MPFDVRGLTALIQANGFTLWHYRTADARAEVLAAGYLAAAADRVRAGDVVIVQAADATALLPIRAGGAAGGGLTLDNTAAAVALTRSASQLFSVAMAATAVPRAIALATLPADLEPGDPLPVTAAVTGPIARVTFTLRNAAGAALAPAQTAAVAAGAAAALFAAPAVGNGYRIHAADADDPDGLATRSPPFATGAAYLLLENGGLLLAEQGGALLL